MERALNQAATNDDAEGMLNVLHCLSTVAVSAQLLRSSTIARSVGRLRKHRDPGIAAASSDIIKKWKALFRDEQSQSPRAAASAHHQRSEVTIIPAVSLGSGKATAKAAKVTKAIVADYKRARSPSSNVTITFTFGDRAENGPGMQHVLGPRGALTKGLELKELRRAHTACLAEVRLHTQLLYPLT